MTKFYRTTIVFIVLTTASPGLADPWGVQKYPAEKFQVEWSGQVKVTPTTVTPQTQKLLDHSTNYLQEAADDAYMVVSTENLYSVKFDEGKKASFDTYRCKSVTDRPLDLKGMKAAEMVGTDCDNDFRVRARYFAKGKHFYQVMAIVTRTGDMRAGDHFIESFKVTGD